MTVEPGSIALISGGLAANLGKIVFVVGCPDDPRLPRVGGGGTVWDVQMIATPPLGLDGEEYLRIGIGEDWLMPLPVPKDLAAKMRECGLANVLHRAMEELLQEGFGDDGFVESAGTESRNCADGGEMTESNDSNRQQELALDYEDAAADDAPAGVDEGSLNGDSSTDLQQLAEKLERTVEEAVKLMTAPSRSPEEVRRLNLLDEERLYLRGEIVKLEIKEMMADPKYAHLKKVV